MNSHRHYSRAPLREAIIEFRFHEASSLELPAIDSLAREFGYTRREKLLHGHVTVNPSESGEISATARHDITGVRYVSTDNKYVLGLRVNGFTFSRLAPYENWEIFRDEGKRLWAVFRAQVGPLRIGRVALRYVNQLDIPLPIRDFRDFVRTYPEVSTDLPQLLENYFMQLHIPQPDINGMLVLTQLMVPPTQEGVVSLVLDIDVFRQNLDLGDDGIWNVAEVLRVKKNDTFESCITNNTRELIK